MYVCDRQTDGQTLQIANVALHGSQTVVSYKCICDVVAGNLALTVLIEASSRQMLLVKVMDD